MNTLFNEGGPSGLGYSEIEAYLRCPKEYQFAKIRGISRLQTCTPDYFAIGSFLHAGRARWFASQFSTSDETWNAIRADITKTRSEFELPCNDAAESLALRYIQEYVEHWSVREKPKIAAVEHMLGPTSLGENDPETDRTARLDDFGFYPEAGGKLLIGECKTTAAAISDVANQYTLHGQPLLQRLLWDLAPQGAATYGACHGMLLDVIQKGYSGKRCTFARLVVPIEERTLVWFKAQLLLMLKAKASLTWNSEPERRITSCTRLIGKARIGCDFRDLCQFGRAGSGGLAFKNGELVSSWKADSTRTDPWE